MKLRLLLIFSGALLGVAIAFAFRPSATARYQIINRPGGHLVLFDTATGRVWQADPDATNWTAQILLTP